MLRYFYLELGSSFIRCLIVGSTKADAAPDERQHFYYHTYQEQRTDPAA